MSQIQALKEARRRWGPSAVATRNPAVSPQWRCQVGTVSGYSLVVLGEGETFSAAFAAADARAEVGRG